MELKSRFRAIKAELDEMLKPVFAAAIAIGGGLIPAIVYLFGWLPTWVDMAVLATAITLAVLLWLVWRLSKHAAGARAYDRYYLVSRTCWRYTLSKDGTALDGEQEGEQVFICQAMSMAQMTISVSPKEDISPSDADRDYRPVLLDDSTREHGTISLRGVYRAKGTSVGIQIDFNPPLRKGEKVRVHYRFSIPAFKFASRERLLLQLANGRYEPREYEYNSISVLYPIELLRYEFRFSTACRIRPAGIDVVRGSASVGCPEEQDFVRNSGSYHCEEHDGAWKMLLERKRPPIGVSYVVKWIPANEADSYPQVSMSSAQRERTQERRLVSDKPPASS